MKPASGETTTEATTIQPHKGRDTASCRVKEPLAPSEPATCPRPVEFTRMARPPTARKDTGRMPVFTMVSVRPTAVVRRADICCDDGGGHERAEHPERQRRQDCHPSPVPASPYALADPRARRHPEEHPDSEQRQSLQQPTELPYGEDDFSFDVGARDAPRVGRSIGNAAGLDRPVREDAGDHMGIGLGVGVRRVEGDQFTWVHDPFKWPIGHQRTHADVRAHGGGFRDKEPST